MVKVAVMLSREGMVTFEKGGLQCREFKPEKQLLLSTIEGGGVGLKAV
jgi:hypothetical protein